MFKLLFSQEDCDNSTVICPGVMMDLIILLALKHALVGMYIERLKERQHRKTIARDHGLITSKHKLTGDTVFENTFCHA
jgi:hypothetical protein